MMARTVSKWCRAGYFKLLVMHGVLKPQGGCVQAQTITQRLHVGGGIQCISQHRVANMGHVHTQLV